MKQSQSHFRILFLLFAVTAITASCSKTGGSNATVPPVVPVDPVNPAGKDSLSYGDSVFYLSPGTDDYVVSPVRSRSGQYFGFPEGIQIDVNTGAINVSASETGLRYRISFVADGSTDTLSTMIVLSGINFLDGFYKLTGKDSVLTPVYDAVSGKAIPGQNGNTVFDEGLSCNSAGCDVNTKAGSINLAQTVRNGVFGATPSNNDRHEYEMSYRIDDGSHQALNKLKVKLYYFATMEDVTSEAYDIISSRDGTILGVDPMPFFQPGTGVNGGSATPQNPSLLKAQKPAKPRPPCIFIIAK
jgi:hypothetical protein